jgi:Amt family ammonium transporter
MLSELWIFGAASLLLPVGFALFQSGISRARNAASSIFRGIAQICIGILAFWAFGAALLIGSPKALLDYGGILNASALFPVAIVLMAVGIVSGATLERSRLAVCFIIAILMAGVVTPLCWHLARSSWLIQLGFTDFAGASYVHFSAGLAAMIAALFVGPRNGKYNHDGSANVLVGHSVPLASAGLLVIVIGWIPSIAAAAMTVAWDTLGKSVVNTVVGGAAGAVATMLYSRLRHGKYDIFQMYAGIMGGLVATTAGGDRMASPWALFSGAAAGLIVPICSSWIDMRLRIDDPATGITSHGVAGIWAMLAGALFSGGTLGEHWRRLGAAGVGLAAIAALTTALVLTTLLLLRITVGVRATEQEEMEGLDLVEHDLNAYPDFQQTTIKSYHLREI